MLQYNGKPIDINIIVIIEQILGILDNKLKKYIIVNYKSKILYITKEEIQIPKEYSKYQDIFKLPKDNKLLEYSLFNYKIRIKKDKKPRF